MKPIQALTVAAGLCGVLTMAACNQSPANFQKELQEKLIKAKAGDVIEIPAGKFHLDRTLSLTADKVTIRGRGMDKSILSFAGQKEGGSGLLVKANDFVIEDMAIEDSAGDGLTVQGGNGVTIRRVRVSGRAAPTRRTVLTRSIPRSARMCWWKTRWPRERRTPDFTSGSRIMS